MSDKKANNQQEMKGQGRGPGPGGPGGPMRHMGPKPKVKDVKGTVRRILKYLSGRVWMLATIIILSGIATLISIFATRLNGVAVDDYIAVGNLRGLVYICLLLLGIQLVNIVSNYIQNLLMINVSQKTVRLIRNDLFSKLQKLPISYFDKHSSGDLMSRLTNDVDNISMSLSQSVVQLFSGVINITGMFVAMLILSPILTAISLTTIPVVLFTTKLIVKRTKKHFFEQQKELGELNGYIEEVVSGQKAVKLFGREEKVKNEFSIINKKLTKTAITAQILSGIMGPIMNMLNNITYLVVAVSGAYLILKGSAITVGIIFTFMLYMRNFARPINEMANLYNSIQSALAGAERVFEVMDEVEECDDEIAVDITDIKGNVEAKDIHFRYDDTKVVLKNATFDAKQGETVAIVGPTGAGKTTIISLLTRFYDYKEGLITIDGNSIDNFTRNSLRKSIGMVLQDTFLFSESVMENIRYGRIDATDEEVIEAAKLANVHSFVSHLPEGYNTILTDNGGNLSQGQRQLLAIARAILADPAILILDEATSSIDTRTEVKIQESLLKLMEGKTSFVIAHRLSTIKNADKILVVNDGEIVENGTHDELISKDGFYANLYNSQFKTGLSL